VKDFLSININDMLLIVITGHRSVFFVQSSLRVSVCKVFSAPVIRHCDTGCSRNGRAFLIRQQCTVSDSWLVQAFSTLVFPTNCRTLAVITMWWLSLPTAQFKEGGKVF
jgi:hypothetical protein